MGGFFKKVNQTVNLERCPMPDAHLLDAHPDSAILKDGFLKTPSKKNVLPSCHKFRFRQTSLQKRVHNNVIFGQ